MRKMGLILDRFDPGRGGLESYARFLLERFVEQQGEALLITGPSPRNVPKGVCLHTIPATGPAFYTAVSRLAPAMRDTHVLLSMRHPGEAAEVFLPLGGLFRDALEAKRRAEPLPKRLPARLARWVSPKSRFFLAEEHKFFARGEGLVLCSSDLVAGRIREAFPAFRGCLDVTGLPVDPERFSIPEPAEVGNFRKTLGLPPEPAWLLLWVGNDPRRKGLPLALATLGRLRQRKLEAYLLCLGRNLPRRLARNPYCILRWAEDPSPYFKASDLFLLPSLEDNYSLSLLEAMACGLPSITTLANGAHVHIRDSIDGRVLSRPDDLDALDRAALCLLQKSSLAQRLHRRGSVADNFEDKHFLRLWNRIQTHFS